MHYKDIIRDAWEFTRHSKSALLFGVIPSFFIVLGGIAYVAYQYLAFRASAFFAGDFDFGLAFNTAVDFFSNHHNLFAFAVVLAVLIGIGFFLLPPFCTGAIIGLATASRRGTWATKSDGFAVGAEYFLRLFEYNLIVATFSFVEFFTVFSLALRYFGPSGFLIGFFLFLFCISLTCTVLFIYGEFFIVLKGDTTLSAFRRSAGLVVANIGHTFFTFCVMLLILLRVLFNAALLFFVPIIIFFIAGFFATTLSTIFGVAVGGILTVAMLLLTSYIAGHFFVFTIAAWTFTFLAMSERSVKDILA